MADGAATAVKMAIAGWVTTDSPAVDSDTSGVAWLNQELRPVTYAIFALALMYQAARMALSHRGEDLRKIGQSVLLFVIVAFAGAALVGLITQAGDAYSTYILDASTNSVVYTDDGGTAVSSTDLDLGTKVLYMLGLITTAGAATGTLSTMGSVGFILGLILALASLLQVVMIYVRSIILILMMGLLPVVAASALTDRGRQVLDHYISWVLAWVLYKPTAASIYACGFFMMGSSDTITGFVVGAGCIVMALFSLPALMRVLNPMIGSMGAATPGVGDLVATGAAVASGQQSMLDGATSVIGGTGSDTGQGTGAVRDATYGGGPPPPPSGGGVDDDDKPPPGGGASPPPPPPPPGGVLPPGEGMVGAAETAGVGAAGPIGAIVAVGQKTIGAPGQIAQGVSNMGDQAAQGGDT